MQTVNFFYDQQIRRFILQFIRMLSGFQVQFNTRDAESGALSLRTVPVFYGDQSRQAAQILRGVSENATATVPAMAVYISALDFDQSRMQDPFMVSKIQLRERRVDPETGEYTDQQGDAVSIERPMPMPYRLTLKLDIWTSNTEQKLQLIEQLATVFNPSLEIQSTDNYVDWTSLSAVLLTRTVWDSRTVPMGGEDAVSIATMEFELPIWISPPARINRLGIVERLVQNVFDSSGQVTGDLLTSVGQNSGGTNSSTLGRTVNTLMNYALEVRGNQMKLLRYNDTILDPDTAAAANLIGGRNGRVRVTEVDQNGAILAFELRSPGVAYPANGWKIGGDSQLNGQGAKFTWSAGDGTLPDDMYVADPGSGYIIGEVITIWPSAAGPANITGSSGNAIDLSLYPAPINVDPNQLGDYIVNRSGADYSWENFLKGFGEVRPGLSEIRIRPAGGSEIVATFAVHPTDPGTVIFDAFPDTLPANTIPPVEAVIDPFKPGIEKILFDNQGNYQVAAGTRYLITDDIGNNKTFIQWSAEAAKAWAPNGNPLVAHANDIIEFDGTKWRIVFDSLRVGDKQYITNMTTGIQYRWSGESWVRAHDGIYPAGSWSLIL